MQGGAGWQRSGQGTGGVGERGLGTMDGEERAKGETQGQMTRGGGIPRLRRCPGGKGERRESTREETDREGGGEHAVLLTSGEGVHESGVWSRRRG